MDGHTGAFLFLQFLNGFIGNLPGAGRGFGWVLPAVLGGSELAGAFQSDTAFSVKQQREKLCPPARGGLDLGERWGIRVAGAQMTGRAFCVHIWLAGGWGQGPASIRGWRLVASEALGM